MTTLISLLLPAMQSARESSRRTTCAAHVRAAAAGIVAFESARRTLPPGSDQPPREPGLPQGTLHAWSSFILPYVEETALAGRIDYTKAWDAAGGNHIASDTRIASYVCPSALVASIGEADYAGISGAVISSGEGFIGQVGLANGLLVAVDGARQRPVRVAEATDGLSNTLLVAEAVDRCPPEAAADTSQSLGRWALINHFAQSERFINSLGGIRSRHAASATVAFGDGRVVLLHESMDPLALAAICTRDGGEATSSSLAVQ